jgi:hypothetical protein
VANPWLLVLTAAAAAVCPSTTFSVHSKDSTTAIDCYIELAEKVRAGLSHIDPYFQKLADGMLAWVDCWQKVNPETIAKAVVV